MAKKVVPKTGTHVITAEQSKAITHPAPAPTNMLQVISQAVMDPRCDVEKMRALLDMQRDIEDRDAKKAFTRAFNALQAELPIINKDGKIDHSSDGGETTRSGKKALKTGYATYPNLNRVVGPLMKQYGFTFSTVMVPDPAGPMVVTSTLSHVEGDSRTTHFRVTADATGGKNNQQGWGSSQQYGMRYNMIALLNIVTEAREDADNDGFKKDDPITQAQLAELVKLADEVNADRPKFCEVMGVGAMAEIRQSQFEQAKQQLNRKKKRKQQAASDFPGDR